MSIRNRLLWSLLAAIGGLWLVAIGISYVDVHRELDQLFDAQLAQSAKLLSSQAGHELLELEAIEQEDVAQYAQRFAVQLWSADGALLLRMGPAPPSRLSPIESGFSDAIVDGIDWRVYSDRDLEHGILVQMGEPHTGRQRLAAQMAIDALLPLLVALPLMGALIWWIVSRGLAPIRRIGEQVARREPQNLEPLGVETPPAEVQPLIERLNDLFRRIRHSVENEKRFTADAAHELRNPVAAIRAQAEASLGEQDLVTMRSGLSRIVLSATRLSRLVDQLLLLARLDAKGTNLALPETDLVRVARQTLAEMAPGAIERGASVHLDAPERAFIRGDAALLESLLGNLIDNAMAHGGAGVHITTRIVPRDGALELSVIDDGAGVPLELHVRLGQRFFRGEPAAVSGSGLGLSIVSRIAELHGAAIRFGPGPADRGLSVQILFPQPFFSHSLETPS